MNALKKIKHDVILIVIAHRLSTIVNADNIIVMKEGKIVEEGTHSSLLKLKGQYFQLYRETT